MIVSATGDGVGSSGILIKSMPNDTAPIAVISRYPAALDISGSAGGGFFLRSSIPNHFIGFRSKLGRSCPYSSSRKRRQHRLDKFGESIIGILKSIGGAFCLHI